MTPFRNARARVATLFALFAVLASVACSSSTSNPPAATPDAGPPVDAAIGPLFCDVPVPSTCPTTAPCSFATWKCAPTACDGYFVVTDGTWDYYYSSPGGEFAGEVSAADAAFVSCPYAFLPPMGCTPAVASQCGMGGMTSPDGG